LKRGPNLTSLRILIIAGDPLARAGLAMLLSGQSDFQVIGQLAGEASRAGILETYPADVLLWDLGWNASSALEQLAGRPQDSPPVTVILSDPSQAAEAWAAGARGILPRDTDAPGLGAALIAVSQGLLVFDPSVTASLLPSGDHLPGPTPGDLTPRELTPRELQVVQLLAEGLPNKGIAGRLEISEHTVKFHLNAIMGKLGAQSRTDAVMRATRAGLIVI
jgi:DNA-binding NarL/FixJ family response regulator